MEEHRDTSNDSGKTTLIAVVIVALLALAAGVYMMEGSVPELEPVATQLPSNAVLEPAEPIEPEPEPETAPPVAAPEPVDEVISKPKVLRRAVPALNESDSTALAWLSALSAQNDWAKWWIPKELLRKIVLQVDNIRQGKYARKYTPLKPTLVRFAPETGVETFQLGVASYQRFDLIVDTLVNVDVDTVHELYLDLLPLLQQAQQELGYRDSQTFERSLLSTINHLLNAPVLDYYPELHRPGVFYQFKDESLENLPATYKLLLRMGPENMKKIKIYLSAFKVRMQKD
jgi:hypothetical protein